MRKRIAIPVICISLISATSPDRIFAFQPPTRRSLIEYGEQILKNSERRKILNTQNIGKTTYEEKVIPLLNFAFERPAEDEKGNDTWRVFNYKSTESKFGSRRTIDGDYIVVDEQKHDEEYLIFIYSKQFDAVTTIDTVKQEWAEQQKQPDHDNVYEYSELSFIRELNVIRTDETMFLGRPALFIEYTFSNWSKFWSVNAVMFPWGKNVYTIKYRREQDKEDKFFHVFQHVLDTFRFLTDEPRYSSFSDVSANHENARAIERLKDLKIIAGYPDGTFQPQATVSRAEFVKILMSPPLVENTDLRLCDISSINFSDVPRDSWFAPHVCLAKARGTIVGYPDGTFRPESLINFAEAAKIVASFFSENEIQIDTEKWFAPFISYLENMKAIPISVSSIASPVTRGEITEMIYRLHEHVSGESKGLVDLE